MTLSAVVCQLVPGDEDVRVRSHTRTESRRLHGVSTHAGAERRQHHQHSIGRPAVPVTAWLNEPRPEVESLYGSTNKPRFMVSSAIPVGITPSAR